MALPTYNLSKIQTLSPALKPLATTFLERCHEAGIPTEIVEGTRSLATQAAVYAQGRTAPGPIVSDAPPGHSYHNFELAFDAVPSAYKGMKDWNPTGPLWARIGSIGKSLGLEWGGDWGKPDRPHFQLPAAPLAELRAYWNKFKKIMPISIEPSDAGLAVLAGVAGIWFGFIAPRMKKARLLR